MRPDLAPPPATRAVEEHVARYRREVVDRVKQSVAANDVVVVGMAWNRHVRSVRRALDQAGVKHEYLEHGNYVRGWKDRLAIKLWSGWPTFPQVFVKGTLVGGEELTVAALADGSLRQLLDGPRAPDATHPPMTPAAAARCVERHRDVVDRVRQVVGANDVVVVGMAWNTPAKRVRAALDQAGVKYEYHEIGNYLGKWPQRLAVKLWSGWPTFPQVFVKGTFVGGHKLTEAALADGSLRRLLEGERVQAAS